MKKYTLLLLSLLIIIIPTETVNAQRNAAQDFIAAQNYDDAIRVILRSNELSDLSTSDLETLGICYIRTKKHQEAESVFKEIISRKNVKPKNVLQYADLLFNNGKYEQAKIQYQAYLDYSPDDFLAQLRIQSCDSLSLWNSENKPYRGAYFSNFQYNGNETEENVLPRNFLFISRASGTEEHAEPFDKSWLTEHYWCSSLSYSKETDIMAFSVRRRHESKKGISYGNSNIKFGAADNTDIEQLEPFTWEGRPADINVAHPSFARGGTRLYFASDMPGGYGGMDLYYSDLKGDAWQPPINLGAVVNTPLDELSPAVWHDTLFFSSEGHPGYGNLDVFYSIFDENDFSEPVNMRAPINSTANDLYFFQYNEHNALVSSDRDRQVQGVFEIISVNLPDKIHSEDTIQEPEIAVFYFDTESMNMPYVFFGVDKYSVHKRFNESLAQLADTLKKYDYLYVNLAGYTDTVGRAEYNQNLSEKRAASVAEILKQFEIDTDRISVKAHGESQDTQLENLKYHVFVGMVASDDASHYYASLLNHEYTVEKYPYGRLYAYYVGAFSDIEEAQKLAASINKKFGAETLVGAAYKGVFLPDYSKAINRRVSLKLYHSEH